MTETVAQDIQVSQARALADNHDAASERFQFLINFPGDIFQVLFRLCLAERLRQNKRQGHLSFRVRQPGAGGNKTDLPTHNADYQYRVAGITGLVLLVRFQNIDRQASDGAAVARVMVTNRKGAVRLQTAAHVVIYRLGDSGADQVQTLLLCQVINLIRGIHGIVSAAVKEITDFVFGKNLHHPVQVLFALYLVSAAAENPG